MAISVSKRTQHCTLCKNHGFNTPKKGHHCFYLDCLCVLCKLTKKAQVAMRHQQRVWRHQKQKLKSQKLDIEDISNSIENKSSKSQACDKCRNHNILTLKRNHQCRYMNCSCEYCSLTFKRREIMKHQQRVRRSKITTQVDSELIGSEQSIAEKSKQENGKEYVYFRNEERQNNLFDRHTEHREKTEVPTTPTSNEQPINRVAEKEVSIIHMENLSLKPGLIENEKSQLYHQPYSTPFKSTSPLRSFLQDPIKESPPSANEVLPTHTSSPQQCSPIVRQPISSPHPLCYQPERKVSHSYFETYSCSPTQYEPCHEDHDDDSQKVPSLMVTPIDISRSSPTTPFSSSSSIPSSFQSFSFAPSQPLHGLSALNAPLERNVSSMKFPSHMDAFSYVNNRGWLSSSLIGSPFENLSRSTALFLHHRHQQQQHSQQHQKQYMQASNRRQTVCPPPVNMLSGRQPPTDSFQPGFWNQMLFPFKPFNFNFSPKNPMEPCFEQYSGIDSNFRFPHSKFFQPTRSSFL